jgi:tetratricopeptide (TPR) repeat protein
MIIADPNLYKAREAQQVRSHYIKSIHSSRTTFIPGKEACWVVPFERNQRFVDRELLTKIKRKLFVSRQMQTIAIVGLGGVGKTQISLELAFQTKATYPDCSVFWIPVVNMESVQQAYQEIASQLGIRISDGNEEDVKEAVQRHLSRPQSGRWLLIFDNADDLNMWTETSPSSKSDGLRKYLPRTSDGQGAILFTTRSSKVAQYLASTEIIEIPEMDEYKATKVLKNLLINKALLDDQESTKKLLERLTYLPLAIVQAASFINENLMDISSYVKLLDGQAQDTIDLLSEEFEDEGRYKSIRNPVATTWLTSFDQIRRQNTLAFDFLAFMACVNSRDIPLVLLPLASPVEREKALGLLCSYSFVHTHNAGSRLDMHRLVQLATANWLKSVNSLRSWHSYALNHISKVHPAYDGTQRSEWRAAMPHALQILHLTSNEPATPETLDLLCTVGFLKREDGRYKESSEILELAVKISDTMFGRDDPRSLKAHEYLGTTYIGLGNFEKAIKILQHNLELRKSKFGIACYETHETMRGLAHAYRLRSRPQNHQRPNIQDTRHDLELAEKLGIQVVRYCIKTWGPEDPRTLSAMYGLTLTYLSQGRLLNAEELAQQYLAIQTKVVGPEDLLTLSAMGTLADIYLERWRLEDAELLYADSMVRAKKFLGPEHPIILQDMHQMAWILKLQKKHSEALALMTECVSLSEKSLGASHYTVEESRQCLRDWTERK